MERVRIGNGCGFWGDNEDAPIHLVDQGQLDYLTLEYLAELTMSILAKQKEKDEERGYAADFLDVLERLALYMRIQPGLKIITNAGGMNPAACARKARAILDKNGLADRKIGVVSGDDLMPRLSKLTRQGHSLSHLDTGDPLQKVLKKVVSANAYLGARPIAEALKLGASVVITGRVADASLTVGPAVHELGWEWDDWDRLSGATVAGHLIECGAQVTGGLWSNWREAPDLADVGYPIAVIAKDGSCEITKPRGTGGAVNRETVSEQLLYEVGDPAAYLTPDVTADFTSVTLTETRKDTVLVTTARGKPATDSYKVSIAHRNGFMASGTLVIFGPEAQKKAKACGEMILKRLERCAAKFRETNIECLGTGACVPGLIPVRPDQHEVVLRVSVRDAREDRVERFTKELAPLVTSGPPGVTGYTTGRPKVREIFAFWPALIDKSCVEASVSIC